MQIVAYLLALIAYRRNNYAMSDNKCTVTEQLLLFDVT